MQRRHAQQTSMHVQLRSHLPALPACRVDNGRDVRRLVSPPPRRRLPNALHECRRLAAAGARKRRRLAQPQAWSISKGSRTAAPSCLCRCCTHAPDRLAPPDAEAVGRFQRGTEHRPAGYLQGSRPKAASQAAVVGRLARAACDAASADRRCCHATRHSARTCRVACCGRQGPQPQQEQLHWPALLGSCVGPQAGGQGCCGR